MKKSLYIAILCIFSLLITGCHSKGSSKDKNALNLSLDQEGNYTGFHEVEEIDNAYDALKKGYLVKENGLYIGNEYWNDFVKKCDQGENTSLRILIMADDADTNYIDLYYQDGFYYAFNKKENDLEAKGYKYLLNLESDSSKDGNSSYYTVLSDDDTLTFSEFAKELMLSRIDVNEKSYKILLSDTKE